MSVFNQIWDKTINEPLWKPLKSSTGLTDAQLLGIGALAIGGAVAAGSAGAAGASSGAAGAAAGGGAAAGAGGAAAAGGAQAGAAAAVPESSGLLGTFGKVAGAGAAGLGIANQVNGMLKSQPMQAGQLPQRQGPDFSGLLAAQTQQQQAMSQEQQLRKQQQQAAIQGLLNGGAYGRVA